MTGLTIKETLEGQDTSPLARRYKTDGIGANAAFANSYLNTKSLKGRSPALIREIEYRRDLALAEGSYGESLYRAKNDLSLRNFKEGLHYVAPADKVGY